MRRAPLLLPAAALLAAIVGEGHGLGFVALTLATALLIVRRPVGVGACVGLIVGALHGHPSVVEREYPTARYVGVVSGDVRSTDGDSTEFPFRVAGFGTLRGIAHLRVRPGERLAVRARISPLDTARNPGEPSPRALALDDGIVGTIAIQRILTRTAPDLRDPQIWTAVTRDELAHAVRAALPEPEATVLTGSLWGERGTLPRSVRDDFQATGTVHVLVTAGLHLGVIAGLAAGGFALLRLPRVAAALASIPIVYGYAWLSGWHLPAQRAAAMITVALLARACGARAFSLNTLAIAAIVVACCWPVAVASISFALSFSCVAAIVVFAQPLNDWLAERRVPGAIAEAIALTLSTQIGVWPLTAAVFFSVAPYAMLANAIIVPLIGLTMGLGLLTVVTHPFGALGAPFARWEQWLLDLVLLVVRFIATLPGARLTIPPPPMWAIALYDALVLAAAVIARQRPALRVVLVTAACAGVIGSAEFRAPDGFAITALDVGQGDSIVIRTPHGRTIMIDAGGRLEHGAIVDGKSPAERSAERIVLPYLQRAGIRTIDLLILTHPHGDHVGGCLGIVAQFAVGQIFDSGQSYAGRAYADCRRAAMERHVPIRVVRRGVHWSTDDGVSLDVLAPTEIPLSDTGDDINENSIVVRLTYARSGEPFSALFMGDAGMTRESELIENHINLRATFLKVGHHGSGYASKPAFLAAVLPRYAVISVGRHNLFGHPAPATIDTFLWSARRSIAEPA